MFFKSKTTLEKSYPDYIDFVCSGLGNPGNLCYFNSLMQTFASSTQWTSFFRRTSGNHPLLLEISKVIDSLREPFSPNSSLSTKNIRNLFKKVGLSAPASRQQDFHEFYMKFLVAIENLFHQSQTIQLSVFSTRRIFPSHLVYKESIECQLCHHISCSINQESYLILEVEHGSLSVALQQYFGPITLASPCSKCGRTSNRILTRKMLFPPKAILFFINRRYPQIDAPSTKPFYFPASIEMMQYCFSADDIQNNSVSFSEVTKKVPPLAPRISLGGISEAIQESVESGYLLTSVVCFSGRDNSGHYFAYRVHQEQCPPYAKRWLSTSDNKVTPVTFETVTKANENALLLNYEIPS